MNQRVKTLEEKIAQFQRLTRGTWPRHRPKWRLILTNTEGEVSAQDEKAWKEALKTVPLATLKDEVDRIAIALCLNVGVKKTFLAGVWAEAEEADHASLASQESITQESEESSIFKSVSPEETGRAKRMIKGFIDRPWALEALEERLQEDRVHRSSDIVFEMMYRPFKQAFNIFHPSIQKALNDVVPSNGVQEDHWRRWKEWMSGYDVVRQEDAWALNWPHEKGKNLAEQEEEKIRKFHQTVQHLSGIILRQLEYQLISPTPMNQTLWIQHHPFLKEEWVMNQISQQLKDHPEGMRWWEWVSDYQPSEPQKALAAAFWLNGGIDLKFDSSEDTASMLHQWDRLWNKKEKEAWKSFWKVWINEHQAQREKLENQKRNAIRSADRAARINRMGLTILQRIKGVTTPSQPNHAPQASLLQTPSSGSAAAPNQEIGGHSFTQEKLVESPIDRPVLEKVRWPPLPDPLKFYTRVTMNELTLLLALHDGPEQFAIHPVEGELQNLPIEQDLPREDDKSEKGMVGPGRMIWTEAVKHLPSYQSDLFEPSLWKFFLEHVKKNPDLLRLSEHSSEWDMCQRACVDPNWLNYWRQNGSETFVEKVIGRWGAQEAEERYNSWAYEHHLQTYLSALDVDLEEQSDQSITPSKPRL